ncbi:MAG: large ribosomal subunit protein uL22, partial [Columbia Basin potato purple top phytoplasma]
MKVKAVASQIPVTPRKVCLVVDLIRGQKIKEAEAILTLNSKSAAP